MVKKESKVDISKFFNPKSIAIIGASDNPDKVGGILLENALKIKAKIIPVNPKHEVIFGTRCYKNILDYPKNIDLAIIAVPSLFVLGALAECGRKKVKQVIIVSSGFSEIGNTRGEKELVELANKFNLRFLGTNCFGVANPAKNLDLTFSKTSALKGDIAFVSQSGALWSFLADYSLTKKIGFSSFVGLGNSADLGFNEFIEYFARDKKTKSIILYVEKLQNGKKFMDLCKKCKKPIYAIKAGSSEIGSEAAFSHTASLASDYEIYKGAFKQCGIILCEGIIEALEKASGKKLEKDNKINVKIGRKVFIITNAGGAGALMSDYLTKKGFTLIDKPMDILGTASGSEYFNALEKLKSKEYINSFIILLTSQSMTEINKTAQVIVQFKQQTGKSIIPIFIGGNNMLESNKLFEENNIPYFNTLEEARACLEF